MMHARGRFWNQYTLSELRCIIFHWVFELSPNICVLFFSVEKKEHRLTRRQWKVWCLEFWDPDPPLMCVHYNVETQTYATAHAWAYGGSSAHTNSPRHKARDQVYKAENTRLCYIQQCTRGCSLSRTHVRAHTTKDSRCEKCRSCHVQLALWQSNRGRAPDKWERERERDRERERGSACCLHQRLLLSER